MTRNNAVRGFSLIELLLAGALFAVFSWGVIELLAVNLEADRLGEEMTFATRYAEEAIEAIHSIRARDFDALETTTSTGISRVSGDWVFSGSEDVDDKYVRTIAIESVNRDNGDIVESGGSDDPDTRKAIVTVSWSLSPTRPETVVLETYLTRW